MAQEKWSGKQAAKAGQKFRREARDIFAEYENGLKKKLEELRVIVRIKPRWIPRPVWLWFADIFVDLHSGIDQALVFETPSAYLTRKHHEAAGKQEEMQEDRGEMDEYEESDEIADLLPIEEQKKLSTG